jgi:hypothetical protein
MYGYFRTKMYQNAKYRMDFKEKLVSIQRIISNSKVMVLSDVRFEQRIDLNVRQQNGN